MTTLRTPIGLLRSRGVPLFTVGAIAAEAAARLRYESQDPYHDLETKAYARRESARVFKALERAVDGGLPDTEFFRVAIQRAGGSPVYGVHFFIDAIHLMANRRFSERDIESILGKGLSAAVRSKSINSYEAQRYDVVYREYGIALGNIRNTLEQRSGIRF